MNEVYQLELCIARDKDQLIDQHNQNRKLAVLEFEKIKEELPEAKSQNLQSST